MDMVSGAADGGIGMDRSFEIPGILLEDLGWTRTKRFKGSLLLELALKRKVHETTISKIEK